YGWRCAVGPAYGPDTGPAVGAGRRRGPGKPARHRVRRLQLRERNRAVVREPDRRRVVANDRPGSDVCRRRGLYGRRTFGDGACAETITALYVSMSLSENRYPLFRDMLYPSAMPPPSGRFKTCVIFSM